MESRIENLNFVEDIGRNFSEIFLTFFNKNNSKKFSNKEKNSKHIDVVDMLSLILFMIEVLYLD